MTESLCCTAKVGKTLSQLYFNLKNKNSKRGMKEKKEIFLVIVKVLPSKTMCNFYVLYADEMHHLAISKIIIFT